MGLNLFENKNLLAQSGLDGRRFAPSAFGAPFRPLLRSDTLDTFLFLSNDITTVKFRRVKEKCCVVYLNTKNVVRKETLRFILRSARLK